MAIMFRHLIAILLMPFMVAVVLPQSLLRSFAEIDSHWMANGIIQETGRAAGIIILTGGVVLFLRCAILFAIVGRGTIAPWDPTQNLVAVGPYAFVRNPMISGVAMTLIGQALVMGSWIIGIWAGIFVCINHLYFVLSEEPGLEARFGDSYREYKKYVPRWIPLLRPHQAAPKN